MHQAADGAQAGDAVTPPAPGPSDLSRRAGMTFLSGMVQQAARIVTGLALTPIIIRGLGAELYGAWTMIQQTVGYLALGDARPMGTLKFTLAVEQHVDDYEQKRRQVGAALAMWALTLPILLALGGAVVWAAPHFIRTDPAHNGAVRAALAVAVLTLGADRVLSLPGNILRGLNLEYRLLGWNGALALLSGILSAGAVWLGWGLVGLAWASLVTVALSAGVAFTVMRRVVPWFGVQRPGGAEIRRYSRLGGWLFIGSLGTILLTGSDLLAVGIVLGPSAAAVYAATGAVLRLTIDPVSLLLGSGNAGIAGLCGRGDLARVRRLHREMQAAGLALMTIVGTGVVLLNPSFLRLWVGPGLFGGHLTNVVMVLLAMERIFFRVDTVVMDGFMEFRRKGIAVLVTGLLGLGLGMLLARELGLAGMAVGTFAGRLGLNVYLPLVIRRRLAGAAPARGVSLARPLATGAALLAAAWALAPLFTLHSWPTFGAAALASGVLITAIVVGAGLDRQSRGTLLSRLSRIRGTAEAVA